MPVQFSLLDKSPIPAGGSAGEALRNTVALARRAEEAGYHRFWVAEHHGSDQWGGPAPEILVSHILAATRSIRVGTGGVMLQHYSPYKVAEVFAVLAALAPERVDLGVGKAPGGLPLSTRALQAGRDPAHAADFARLFAALDGLTGGARPAGHGLEGVVLTPAIAVPPQRFLLGGSPASAELAARHGWDFVFAGHFNGDPEVIGQSVETYRRLSGRPALLAVNAFAAETSEKADRLAGELRIFKLHHQDGRSVNLPSPEAVEQYAREAGLPAGSYRVEQKKPHVVFGTPDRVRAELEALAHRFAIPEIIIDIPVADFSERAATVALLAQAARPVAA